MGGIPGLGPGMDPGGMAPGGTGPGSCMAPGPGRFMTGAAGDPSWLSVLVSVGAELSASESFIDFSGGFTLPAGASCAGSNSGGMKGAPPGGMAAGGDSMMGVGNACGLLIGSVCSTGGT